MRYLYSQIGNYINFHGMIFHCMAGLRCRTKFNVNRKLIAQNWRATEIALDTFHLEGLQGGESTPLLPPFWMAGCCWLYYNPTIQ